MNKIVVNITLVLLVVWVSIKMSMMSNINVYGEIESSYGYIPVIIMYIIEAIALFALFSSTKLTAIGKTIICVFIYFNIINLFFSDNFLRDFRDSSWWMLIFFLFYKISAKDVFSVHYNKIKKHIPYFFMFTVVIFFIVASAKRTLMYGDTFNQLNDIFWVTLLLPFVFLIKNRKFQYLLFSIGIFANTYSLKRSVIIISLAISLVILYIDFIKQSKNKISGILIIGLFIAGGYYAYGHIDEISDSRLSTRINSISEDVGSGRDEIYMQVLNKFETLPIDEQIFGHGFNKVIKDNIANIPGKNVSAHNDFIEMLYDYGLIGLFIYIILVIRLLFRIFEYKRYDINLYRANLVGFIVFILMSLVSHLFIYPTYFCFLAALWGLSEGRYLMLKYNNKII